MNMSTTADTNIHLRARAEDRALLDSVAQMQGMNRSQFILAAGLKEAKNFLLDQTTIYADAKAFNDILDWMDAEPTEAEHAGMNRLLETEALGDND